MKLEEYILHMLEDKDRMRESIRIMREQILCSPIDRNEVIEGLSMGAIAYDDIRTCPTNKQSDRVGTIVQETPREMHRMYRDRAQLRALISLQETEIDTINEAVSRIAEPARSVILLLYYDRVTWNEVRIRLKCSRATVSTHRVQGIVEICEYYKKYQTGLVLNETIGIELES